MIKIIIYENNNKIDFDVFEGEYPGDKNNLKEAINQLFQGKHGKWLIIGEIDGVHIKVIEFHKYNCDIDELVKKSFEELYLNQTGGWFGMDIDRVFKF